MIQRASADQDRKALIHAIERVAAGDRDSFEELYRRTSAKLFGVCLRILPRSDAEEALQDTYTSVWRRAASFDPSRGSPVAWLVTMARNRSIDRLRAGGAAARAAPLELAQAVVDPQPTAFDMLATGEEDRLLGACMEQLDERDARFIRTAFIEGATYAELAERHALPLGTLKSRIRRALLKLRECLE